MPRIQPSHLGKVLYDITADLSEKQAQQKVKEFVSFLQKRRLMKYVPKIIQQYRKEYNLREHSADVTVKSAKPITAASQEQIAKLMTKEFKFKQVDVNAVTDPAVLGGLKVIVDDIVIDDSVGGKIDQLRDYLISNI